MGYFPLPFPHKLRFPLRVVANVVAPPWYNGYRFVLTFIVCTSIIFNLIVKEYLQDTGSTHGKLDNLKIQRKNPSKGAEFGEKWEESDKQKYTPPAPPSPRSSSPVSPSAAGRC